MRRAGEETDAEKRAAILHQAEALLLDRQPYLVLMILQSRNLVSTKMHGWEANVLDHHPGRFISIDP